MSGFLCLFPVQRKPRPFHGDDQKGDQDKLQNDAGEGVCDSPRQKQRPGEQTTPYLNLSRAVSAIQLTDAESCIQRNCFDIVFHSKVLFRNTNSVCRIEQVHVLVQTG